MVYVCTFVNSCLATKANNRLLNVWVYWKVGLLIGVHLTMMHPIYFTTYLYVSRTSTQDVQYNEYL